MLLLSSFFRDSACCDNDFFACSQHLDWNEGSRVPLSACLRSRFGVGVNKKVARGMLCR